MCDSVNNNIPLMIPKQFHKKTKQPNSSNSKNHTDEKKLDEKESCLMNQSPKR